MMSQRSAATGFGMGWAGGWLLCLGVLSTGPADAGPLRAGAAKVDVTHPNTETRNDTVEAGTAALGDEVQMGKKKVKGLEFGASGMLTPAWQLSAGLALMDTEVEQAPNANAGQVGNSLAWSPEVSFTSWTTYKLPMGLTLGGGARYQKSVVRNSNPTSTITNLPSIPSYWVFDAMASYRINKNVDLQFNVYNLTDKDYVAAINKSGYRYTPGAPRTYRLTANFAF